MTSTCDGDGADISHGSSPLRQVMIVAGEASGDIYGADLVNEVVSRDPLTRFFGIGGDRMREAGVDILVESSAMAVMGLVEVAKHFRVIASAYLKLRRILLDSPPDLLILIDYPGFNIRLAKAAKKAGVKVLYYISPKVWAWKAGRIKTIAASVDRMAVIFPFEVPLYERVGANVTFVGHPMLDRVVVSNSRDEAATGLGLVPSQPVIGLFPGSRKSEIERILPAIAAAAGLLRKRCPEIQFVVPLASTLGENDILPHLQQAGIQAKIVRGQIHNLIRACDAIMAVSGTVTLEIALVGTPMVIIYRLAPMTYEIARRVVKIDHIGLCNIVAGKTLVRELIQDAASPVAIAAEIDAILAQPEYARNMRESLATVKDKLGGGGAAARTAVLALELLTGRQENQ